MLRAINPESNSVLAEVANIERLQQALSELIGLGFIRTLRRSRLFMVRRSRASRSGRVRVNHWPK